MELKSGSEKYGHQATIEQQYQRRQHTKRFFLGFYNSDRECCRRMFYLCRQDLAKRNESY